MHTPAVSIMGWMHDGSACTMACSVREALADRQPASDTAEAAAAPERCADADCGHRDPSAALEATLWCPHTAALPSWTPRYCPAPHTLAVTCTASTCHGVALAPSALCCWRASACSSGQLTHHGAPAAGVLTTQHPCIYYGVLLDSVQSLYRTLPKLRSS